MAQMSCKGGVRALDDRAHGGRIDSSATRRDNITESLHGVYATAPRERLRFIAETAWADDTLGRDHQPLCARSLWPDLLTER